MKAEVLQFQTNCFGDHKNIDKRPRKLTKRRREPRVRMLKRNLMLTLCRIKKHPVGKLQEKNSRVRAMQFEVTEKLQRQKLRVQREG